VSTGDRAAKRKVHWAKTRNLTYVVLVIWFAFSVLAPWFAKDLNAVSFLGFPLGYYLLVQGSLIVFVVLIIVQNIIQDGIDDAYGVGGSGK
jgi:putative solute:sodium symporter small subunit